jgi:hypothetical protein
MKEINDKMDIENEKIVMKSLTVEPVLTIKELTVMTNSIQTLYTKETEFMFLRELTLLLTQYYTGVSCLQLSCCINN